MSLNFDFTRMIARVGKEEYDRITDHPTIKGKWHPVTDTLIWATMAVDIGAITEDNVDEFADRLLAVQAVSGPWMNSEDGPFYITREDVRNHIGLRTNVSKKSAAQFAKRLAEMAVEEGKRAERKQCDSAHTRCQPK